MFCICVKKPLPPGDNPIAVNKYYIIIIIYKEVIYRPSAVILIFRELVITYNFLRHSTREEYRKKNSRHIFQLTPRKHVELLFVLQILQLKTADVLLKNGTYAWKHFSEKLSSQEIRNDHILNLTKWFEIKRGLSK
jgi:hypothetical protein